MTSSHLSQTRSSRDWLGFAALGAVFFSFWISPQDGLQGITCLLREWTGVPCPGCGLTRGFASISRGWLASSVSLNPFALPLYLWFLWRAAGFLVPRLRITFLQHSSSSTRKLWSAAFWAMFLMYGGIRMIVEAWSSGR